MSLLIHLLVVLKWNFVEGKNDGLSLESGVCKLKPIGLKVDHMTIQNWKFSKKKKICI